MTLAQTKQRIESKPFVKWAGGKKGLVDSIISVMPKSFNDYFEPFLGGGALFFALNNQGKLRAKKVHLNDKNKELINVYQVVQSNPYALLAQLEELQNTHSKDTFYTLRSLDRNPNFNTLNPLSRAARFIYLNKTCFNGLCRYNAKGEFNTPMGSYKNPRICDKDLILGANYALKSAFLYDIDFEQTLAEAQKGDFIYFDPPYYPLNQTSSFVSYIDNFGQEEQLRLSKVFKSLDSKGVKVLQSNSNTPFIKELYKDFEIIEVEAKRAINCKGDKRGAITELLIRGHYE